MATTKKRSKKTAAQKKAADTRAANKRKQNLRGAAKDSATKAALKRARDPEGVRKDAIKRQTKRGGALARAGGKGTAITGKAFRELTRQAKAEGSADLEAALNKRGAKKIGTISGAGGGIRAAGGGKGSGND